MRTTRLRVTLREVEPLVIRVLDVPADAFLPEVHDLLQAALGWTDSHLHQFVFDGVCYGIAGTDGPEDERDEAGVRLRALPSSFCYLYDFGDGWEHDIELLGSGGAGPGCVSGEGACPPEDVGGPPGYAEVLEVLGDTDHPEHEAMATWAGHSSTRFDLAATDLLVRQMAGAVPEPVRLVLDLAADGVKLTPGGRLPRSFVRQVQEQYPAWCPLGHPAAIEDDLVPLSALHDLLRGVGLLHLGNGVLSTTRAAADDTQVIRRLRSWFGPDDGFTSVLVGETLASLATAGPGGTGELAARVFPLLGNRWVTGEGEPLVEVHVLASLNQSRAALIGLDLIASTDGTWSAGPAVRWLLPRATALAHLWTTMTRP